MQNFNYDQSTAEQYNEDKKIFPWNTNPYQINFELKREAPTPNDTTVNNYHQNQALSRSQLAHLRESPAARARRLARNAERMREKRARESDEERRKRLDKNALNNRLKRLNESPTEKAIRQVRDAARQRLRRAMETQDQRESRLRKLAERMRMVRRHESPDKKAERLAKAAQRARDRLQRETSEERRVRLQKGSDYARRVRSKKSTADCSSAPDTSDSSNQNTISSSIYSSPSSERVLKIPQHQQQHQSVNFYENSVVQSNNYNFVNFNNSLSALAFNDPSSNIPQPVNNSIITLNIPHYHTVFSSQPPPIHQPNHQPKNFINPHVVKEEIYPKHQLMSSTSKNQDVSSSSSDNYLTLKPNESEFERMEKLRKSAELSRLRRNNETPEQRSKRLNDLKMRARKRREEIKNSESEEERKNRLAKQAEYARQRRQRDTKKPDGYLKIGDSQSAILMSDKPSVLKILEPIIEMNTTDIQTIFMFDTDYSADSVEWHREESIFVVGTYQLAESDDSSKTIRKGRIYLFEFEIDQHKVSKLQQVECDAVLDQKWLNGNLITATSTGYVETYSYAKGHLDNVHRTQLNEGTDSLVLSIDVDDKRKRLLASDSCGKLTLIDASTQQTTLQWKCHDFEAWTCSFDFWNENVVYSGGDDSMFNIWDTRTDIHKVKSKKREAGVTSFLSHKENTVFVGSYDEKLCLYDLRNLKNSLDEINLNGGIWRIKKSPNDENVLLTACMYHNFSVIDCSSQLSLIGEYNEHKSICYGCDWSTQKLDHKQYFAACSFYDQRLSVCSFTYDSN